MSKTMQLNKEFLGAQLQRVRDTCFEWLVGFGFSFSGGKSPFRRMW